MHLNFILPNSGEAPMVAANNTGLNPIISELYAAQGIATDTATLYDATTGGALVAPGAPVARLVDKSGNGRHLVQSE